MDGIDFIKRRFIQRYGFFNQKYKSIRFPNKELTIDNLFPYQNEILLCLCAPYNINLDKRKHHKGMGGGEVKRSWVFDTEEEALEFVIKNGMIK